MPLHARTRSVDAWHRSGHWMTTRRRERVRIWPWKTASRPMHSSHIAWPQTSVTVVGSKQMDILRTGAAVVFVEVFYLGVVERGRVAHRFCRALDGVACLPVWNYLLITGSPVWPGANFSYGRRGRILA